MTDAVVDPRWIRFQELDLRCPCCGEPIEGLIDLPLRRPDPWFDLSFVRKLWTLVPFVNPSPPSDFICFGGRYFVRSVLRIPVYSTGAALGFGPWAEVDKQTFEAYRADDGRGALADAEGLLATRLPDLPGSYCQPVHIEFKSDHLRPELRFADRTTGLYQMQRDGITFDRALAIYAAAGVDVPKLLTEGELEWGPQRFDPEPGSAGTRLS